MTINIPTFPTIKVPEFKVSVDTSGISAAVKSATAAGKNIERTSLFSQLAPYKVKTVPIMGKARPLCKEDVAAVTEIVRKLNANNWLDADTRAWCTENGISVL